MTTLPTRVVDAHVHLWDPARSDWYPYLSGSMELDMGDTSGMNRRFDAATYRSETSRWNVEKVVNVAAAVGSHSVDETLELDRRAGTDGHPEALIGGLPPTDSVADAVALIERQQTAPRFRGVRPMGQHAGPLPELGTLRALQERELIFELMAHPDHLQTAAAGLVAVDGLRIVVEHCGWPRSDADEEQRLWDDGMRALADLGEQVHCKLSGLAMPLGSMDATVLAPWIERAIELFGVSRCFFASNFPVDGMHGSFDDLYTAYATVTAGLDDADRDRLFAGSAERLYRV